MRIAQQLKEKNIAEYLLYMWQVEDLIRANGCDVDRVKQTLVSRYGAEGEELLALTEWYENLTRMMCEEDVREQGHLQINKNVVQNLTELHNRLLASPKYPFYSSAYFKALPFIVELRQKSGKKDESELNTCFEALYGIMLLRLQKKEISTDTTKAMEAVSNLLSMLANYYDKDKNGELNLE